MLRILLAFVFLALVISLVFAWVGFSTASPRELDPKGVYRVRKLFFLGLLALLLAFTAATLFEVPYPRAGERPDRVVYVAAAQFAFALSESPVTNEEEWSRVAGEPPLALPSNALIEFRVTSLDVNHGVGLYDPEGRLVAQTQAMPGYVNRLRILLPRAGTWQLLCLEYCGAAHHLMQAQLTVQ